MKYLLVATILIFVLIACRKDNFETKPQLRLISISSHYVELNDSLLVRFSYTDKEGDLDSFILVRERINWRSPLVNAAERFGIPETGKQMEGELRFRMRYTKEITGGITAIGSSVKENDTLNLKFFVIDRENNRSDTVVINNVIVSREP